MYNTRYVSRSVLLANSLAITDEGMIEINPFEDSHSSDDDAMVADDVDWTHDDAAGSSGTQIVVDESLSESWD